MKELLLLFILSGSLVTVKAQNLIWSTQYTTNKENYIYGLNLDNNGNIYVVGRYWPNHGLNRGLFRFKLDPDGNLVWQDTTKLKSLPALATMAGRPDGTCYIAATNNTSFTIGDTIINFGSYYGYNCSILLGQDTDGNILWTRFLPRIEIHSVSVNSDFVYACGKVNSSSVISGHTVLPGG
jgi:hypothetical protein